MEPRDAFKKYLLYSVGFHTLVLILLLLFGRPLPPPPEGETVVTMIRLTRKAGLPSSPLLKKTGQEGPIAPPPPATTAAQPPPAPEAPKPPAPPQPVPQPQVPPKVVEIPKPQAKPAPPKPPTPPPAPVKPTTPPPKTSPDDEKIAQALAGVKGELEQREAQNAAAPAAPATGPGGGPGSPFGSPSGGVDPADPALARYQGQVRSKIIREWVRTSSGVEGETLRARIVVRINASGNVISSSFAKRSGNPSFDLSAQRAVERASPLPPPPPLVMAEALQEGFVVDFSSRMLK